VVTLATSRVLTRPKSRFKSARAAWISIGKATGLEPSDVRSVGHTRTQWRWKRRNSNRKRSNPMAKKRRSAKQRANDRRLGQMARARGRKSAPKRKRSRRKVNKPRKRSPSVAGRRLPSKRSFISKIPLVNNPTVRKVATGIGLATIGATAIAIVSPQIAANPIVKPALALIGGGLPGLIGQVVTQGGLGSLGNIFGGGTTGGTAGGTPSSGFA